MALKSATLRTMKPGRHPDGRFGLYFNVKPSGARSWLQRLTIDGERRTFGLGGFPVVSLSEARETAFENVRLRHRGVNPFVRKALRRVLKRIECSATFHGFRSSFRDWCSETGVDRAAAEWSLAHVFQSDTEKSYARSDLLELRRPLMARWADFITGAS